MKTIRKPGAMPFCGVFKAPGPRFRRLLSSSLNELLNRFGYAIVRIDGAGRPRSYVQEANKRFAYENILLDDVFAPWAIDEPFLDTWKQVRDNTLVDMYRCYELNQTVREFADISGDIVEVGVWRGGSGAILASAAKRYKPDAHVWLCDTFSGVVKTGIFDPVYRGGEHSDTSPRVVEALVERLRLTNVSVLPGVFPDETGTALGDRFVAICHIDVDVYQSAADIVHWLFPRMLSGAAIVFDDYGFSTCKGVTRLVDDMRNNGSWRFFYNLNKHAILIKR